MPLKRVLLKYEQLAYTALTHTLHLPLLMVRSRRKQGDFKDRSEQPGRPSTRAFYALKTITLLMHRRSGRLRHIADNSFPT